MRRRTQQLAVMTMAMILGAASANAAEMKFRDGKTWAGDPSVVQSADNPYVKLAEANVSRAIAEGKLPFWLAWGYGAPESSRRGDAVLRERLLTEMDATVEELVKSKQTFWELLSTLDAIRILQQEKSFPKEKLTEWLTKVRVCVDANYEVNEKQNDWLSRAPNALHQSAAILQLASALYDEPKYAAMARSIIHRTAAGQKEGGAFYYLPESGPSQVYYGFDSTFIGRYYQLSRDPVARDMLVKMAKYADDVLANGLMEGASAPWWKHRNIGGGPMHGVEIVAGVSRDPLVRKVAEHRLPLAQRYYFSYVPMYFWDPTIPQADGLAAKLCRYNANIEGPQVREGTWQVVMPTTGYADTRIGVTVATTENRYKFDGYLDVVALPILGKGVNDPYARPGAQLIAAPKEPSAAIVGDGWIASGSTFTPRPPYFGDAVAPKAAPWRVTQVWFADEKGFGGWIETTCTAKTADIEGPRGFLSFGLPATLDTAASRSIVSGSLQLSVWGDQAGPLESFGEGKRVWVNLKNAGPRQYDVGETFGYGLSGALVGGSALVLEAAPHVASVLTTTVRRGDGETFTLAYNASQEAQSINADRYKGGTVWRAVSAKSNATPQPIADAPLSLAAGELLVIRNVSSR